MSVPPLLFKRMAAFALVLLMLFLLIFGYDYVRNTSRTVDALQRSVDNQSRALVRIEADNRRLINVNDRQTRALQVALMEREAIIRVAVEQARIIREAGLRPVDPFDSAVSGRKRVPADSGGPSPTLDDDGDGPQKPPKPPSGSASPSPTPSPSQTPGGPLGPILRPVCEVVRVCDPIPLPR